MRTRVFVLIDALGWEYVKNREFMSDVLTYRRPLRTVLGYSSGAIPSMLTGLPPQQSGCWNLYYHDPEGAPFRWVKHLSWVPKPILDNRLTRKLVKEAGRKLLGLGANFECNTPVGLLPYFNFSERHNIYKPGGLETANSVFDLLQQKQIPFQSYSYFDLSDDTIFEQATADLANRRYQFYFLYLSEVDNFLHDHCMDPEKIDEKVAEYGQRLAAVYQVARQSYPDLMFSVFSDHGMTPVQQTCNIAGAIERLPYYSPRDFLALYDSTMARFWFFNDACRGAIEDTLRHTPQGRILDDSELEAMGLMFPDRRYGELIFLVNPGVLLSGNYFNTRYLPRGMHGYHPDDRWSDAAFMSTEPPPHAMSSIIDLYSLMIHGIC